MPFNFLSTFDYFSPGAFDFISLESVARRPRLLPLSSLRRSITAIRVRTPVFDRCTPLFHASHDVLPAISLRYFATVALAARNASQALLAIRFFCFYA